MKHKFGAFLLILFGAALVLPAGQRWLGNDNPSQRLGPNQELAVKQHIMEDDVTKTNALCRISCRTDLSMAAAELSKPNQSAAANQQYLVEMIAEHPHMLRLIWLDQEAPALTAGTIDPENERQTAAYLTEARQAVSSGSSYQSPTFNVQHEPHFVLAAAASEGKGLIAIVRQSILHEVKQHQVRNLRMVPYPSEGRFGIKAVDPKTLEQVEVDHPEDNEGTSHYYRREVVVKFRDEPSEEDLEKVRSDIKATSIQKLGYTYVIQSVDTTTDDMIEYFQKRGVEYAEPHFLYMTNENIPQDNRAALRGFDAGPGKDVVLPNDALFSRYQWNLPITGTPDGWTVSTGNDEIAVAVVDTGVDLDHPDLRGHLLAGYNAVGKNTTPEDDVGHGTHVAGVISAITNNREGIAGMTWRNSILPVKVLDQTGAGSTYSVAQGIVWAADNGAKVINMSLGNYANARFLHDAIRYAFDKDVVLIAASGNDNTQQPGYPAAYPEVFAVAATDSRNRKASFSNYGDYIDVAAPGVGIASTYVGNQYAALSGTSMASPHVAALAALIRSVNPELKNTEVYEIMRQTAQDLGTQGKDPYFGFGLINVPKALQLAGQSRQSILFQDDWLSRELNDVEQEIAREQTGQAG
ncbi:S8 family peptidase [Paenibacillus turpanensis]|uniref:S8 family peptidase n=1 Tax=Paenibacillus turpanensis TaxID=2689078 RepID=UPI00140985B5|nr:S8 family peptidase [Paenibacillus turpanensis]